ncbi:MBL fold metallo-hydrolase [Cupriavidus sp. DF5525]|uniref:MBL fold metallo-hydrolase n=1 Tax=Cupriavidus sp. DF5525 TaxID=3160989 RepID=UPI0032DEE5D9
MIRSKVRPFAKAIMILVALGALAIVAYLQHPLFGELPGGERLARIAHSPNQSDGTFHNQIDTPVLTTDESQVSIMLSNAFGKKGHPRPPGAIPAVKADLKALDASQDLVIWLGHSSFFVQLGGRRILIDPVFSINAAPVQLTNVAFDGTGIYAADDMPEVDFLLITHDHYDHLDYPSIRALQPKVKQVVAGLGVGAHFEAWGYDMRTVHEADWYEAIEQAPALQIHVTPARHFSGRTFTRDKALWVGFALVSGQRRLFFSGDSGYAPHFVEVGKRYGPFDWVALDTGQYDPRWANVHMTPEQAAQAAEDLRTRVLMPGHVGRFSISPHDWDDPFKRIAAASQGRSYTLWTPEIGQPMYLDGRAQEFSPWWEAIHPDSPQKIAGDHES